MKDICDVFSRNGWLTTTRADLIQVWARGFQGHLYLRLARGASGTRYPVTTELLPSLSWAGFIMNIDLRSVQRENRATGSWCDIFCGRVGDEVRSGADLRGRGRGRSPDLEDPRRIPDLAEEQHSVREDRGICPVMFLAIQHWHNNELDIEISGYYDFIIGPSK